MQNMNWNYPTSIWFGINRIIDSQKACNFLKITNPLIVTDPGILKTNIVKKINSSLKTKANVFSDVKSNPTGDNVINGVKQFNLDNHDGIIAVGGGSGMDTGKGIAFMAKITRYLPCRGHHRRDQKQPPGFCFSVSSFGHNRCI